MSWAGEHYERRGRGGPRELWRHPAALRRRADASQTGREVWRTLKICAGGSASRRTLGALCVPDAGLAAAPRPLSRPGSSLTRPLEPALQHRRAHCKSKPRRDEPALRVHRASQTNEAGAHVLARTERGSPAPRHRTRESRSLTDKTRRNSNGCHGGHTDTKAHSRAPHDGRNTDTTQRAANG